MSSLPPTFLKIVINRDKLRYKFVGKRMSFNLKICHRNHHSVSGDFYRSMTKGYFHELKVIFYLKNEIYPQEKIYET